MSIGSVTMSPLQAGLAGLQAASGRTQSAADEILRGTLGQPADFTRAITGAIEGKAETAASAAVVRSADEQLQDLVDLLT